MLVEDKRIWNNPMSPAGIKEVTSLIGLSEPPRSKLRGIKIQNLAVVAVGTLCTDG